MNFNNIIKENAKSVRSGQVEITCKCGCGRKRFVRAADVKRGWGLFYSKSCKAKWQERRTGQYRAYKNRTDRISNNIFDPELSADQFFFVRRSNADILGGRGRGRNIRNQDIYRGVIGFDGEITFLSRSIDWEAALIYGETRATLREEDINTSRLTLAVDAVRDRKVVGRVVGAVARVDLVVDGHGAIGAQAEAEQQLLQIGAVVFAVTAFEFQSA